MVTELGPDIFYDILTYFIISQTDSYFVVPLILIGNHDQRVERQL